MNAFMNTYELIVLVVLWIAYFILHSLLASLTIKEWVQKKWSKFTPFYRIAFNILSLVLLIIPMGYMYANRGAPLWQWPGSIYWLANGITVVALIGFIGSIRYYDMREFFGFKQITDNNTNIHDQETLKISPFHRYVRHPWYFFILIIIWCREMDSMYLTSAILLSVYIIVGSKLEEKKLLKYHGEVYRIYSKKVPGIIPRPWRYLSKAQAVRLLNDKHQ